MKTWTILMLAGALGMEVIAIHRLGHSPFVGHMSAYLRSGPSAYLIGWEFGLPWIVLQVAGRVPRRVGIVTCTLALIGAVIAIAIRVAGQPVKFDPSFHVLVSAIALPGIAFAIYTGLVAFRAIQTHHKTEALKAAELNRWYWWLFVLLLSIQSFSLTGLTLSATTWPQTWDAILYKLDHALGSSPAGTLNGMMKVIVGVEAITRLAYASILFSAYICIGMVLRSKVAARVNLWAYVITPFWLPLLFYNWVPASGPIYAFPTTFPAMPDPAMLPLAPFEALVAPRNAMPSMHLSAAIFLLIAAHIVRVRWLQLFAAAMVAMTAWATLALGEHYLVDLIVAFPACAAIAFVTLQPSRRASRAELAWAILSLFVLVSWLSLLRWYPIALTNAHLIWPLTIVGTIVGVVSMVRTVRAIARAK
jgi:PAP2 superfamily